MKIVDWAASKLCTAGGLIGFGIGTGLALVIPAPPAGPAGPLVMFAGLGSMMFWGCLGLGLAGRQL